MAENREDDVAWMRALYEPLRDVNPTLATRLERSFLEYLLAVSGAGESSRAQAQASLAVEQGVSPDGRQFLRIALPDVGPYWREWDSSDADAIEFAEDAGVAVGHERLLHRY